MPQPLPTSNFKWLTDEEMKDLDMMMIPYDSSRGYSLQCDLGSYYFYYLYIYVYFIKCNISFLCVLEYPHDFIKCNASFLCISEYPHELHDLHKDYLLAPECLQIEKNILSDYQQHLLQDEGFSKTHPKLVFYMLICSFILIHSLQVRFLYLCLFVHMYWFINWFTHCS